MFAVFLQDPRFARATMDLIWVPEHDRHSRRQRHRDADLAASVLGARLAAARAAPDPRLAALPGPRCAIVLGGPSGAQHFTAGRCQPARGGDARRSPRQGFSIMATPSRRTPPELLAAVREGLGDAPGFIWDGEGDNPYASILALADAMLVTGDSANMVGEATATGAPVHVFEPSGGRLGKARRRDRRAGAARRGAGGSTGGSSASPTRRSIPAARSPPRSPAASSRARAAAA